ncbi:MAG: hypothetical protein ACPGXL_10315, partial [Chitinophagales bacterium]
MPWFQQGFIPDEARNTLAPQLPKVQKEMVLQRIVRLLEENPPPESAYAYDAYKMNLAVYQYQLNKNNNKKESKKWQRTIEDLAEQPDLKQMVTVKYSHALNNWKVKLPSFLNNHAEQWGILGKRNLWQWNVALLLIVLSIIASFFLPNPQNNVYYQDMVYHLDSSLDSTRFFTKRAYDWVDTSEVIFSTFEDWNEGIVEHLEATANYSYAKAFYNEGINNLLLANNEETLDKKNLFYNAYESFYFADSLGHYPNLEEITVWSHDMSKGFTTPDTIERYTDYHFALATYGQELYDKAVTHFNDALPLMQNNPDLYFGRGLCLLMAEQQEGYEERFSIDAKINPISKAFSLPNQNDIDPDEVIKRAELLDRQDKLTVELDRLQGDMNRLTKTLTQPTGGLSFFTNKKAEKLAAEAELQILRKKEWELSRAKQQIDQEIAQLETQQSATNLTNNQNQGQNSNLTYGKTVFVGQIQENYEQGLADWLTVLDLKAGYFKNYLPIINVLLPIYNNPQYQDLSTPIERILKTIDFDFSDQKRAKQILAFLQEANRLFKAKQYQQALLTYREIIEKYDEQNQSALAGIKKCELALDDKKQEEVLSKIKAKIKELLKIADDYYYNSEWISAKNAYESVLQLDVNNGAAKRGVRAVDKKLNEVKNLQIVQFLDKADQAFSGGK